MLDDPSGSCNGSKTIFVTIKIAERGRCGTNCQCQLLQCNGCLGAAFVFVFRALDEMLSFVGGSGITIGWEGGGSGVYFMGGELC